MQIAVSALLMIFSMFGYAWAENTVRFTESNTSTIRTIAPSKPFVLSLTKIKGEIVSTGGDISDIWVVAIMDPLTKRYMFDVFPGSKRVPLSEFGSHIKPEKLYIDNERFALFGFRSAGTSLKIIETKKWYNDEKNLVESIQQDIEMEGPNIRFSGPKSFVTHVDLVGRIDRSFMRDPTISKPHDLAYLSAVSVGQNGNWIVILGNEKKRQIRIELSPSLQVIDLKEIESTKP